MGGITRGSRGFTLIAALLLLILLSGVAIGLMYVVNTETRVGGNDLENNLAYYGAEAGMEKMTADLAALYTSNQAPTVANITALGAFPPTGISGLTYTEYQFVVPNVGGIPTSRTGNVSSGPNQGLVAQVVPMTLQVTAQRPLGDQVRMLRSVEVALIPVFQFGVFSDSDLSYFPGPSFDFAGRVHTNGNLFLAESNNNGLIFHSKITAVGEVVRDKLANGVDVVATGRNSPVYVPNAPAGCDAAHPATNCLNLGTNQGSWQGGVPPSAGAKNNSWVGISTGTFASWIVNGRTGANRLQLPFVGGGVGPIQIIRKPPAGEPAGSALGASRLYTQAQIRVLMADTVADLHPERGAVALDAEDVQLNALPGGVVNVNGVGNTFIAQANTNCGGGLPCDLNTEQLAPNGTPLIQGWLRVEYRNNAGNWIGVTNEWLQQGFARGIKTPNSELGNTATTSATNTVHLNAILMLQMQADRNGNGLVQIGDPNNESVNVIGANSQFNWYPINFYDAREGEVRDVVVAGSSCSVNGIMNAVEIDVRNLRRWLTGAIGANGVNVDWTTQHGYVLYFSDRRGMIIDPNAVPAALTGESGLEDVINAASGAGTPDQILEPGANGSPEDVDGNNLLDNWGATNIGNGFGVNTAVPRNPFGAARINCFTVGRKNRVTGARHVLKLVNGARGNLPTRPDGTGGFTVAAENPVYVQGNYNANNGGWTDPHAAAAVIADTVTLLSNGWDDIGNTANNAAGSMRFPTQVGNRVANTTWYRMAIAAGKNKSFPQPTGWAAAQDYGTDGGLHNFLRYVESWGGTLNYKGSLVSLYYSQYNTSIYKCCTVVYSPPTRAYSFDILFLNPSNLPPGTPSFRDVANVGYRQDFTPY
jgi:hypothetical protein